MRAWVRREPILIAILGFGALLFVYRWAVDNNRPHDDSLGWHAFHDQGYYYAEAGALARLEAIPASDFVYGPGYPALAAPFARIGNLGWPSGDPFFTADLAVWLLTLVTTYLVARRIGGEWMGFVSAVALAAATPLVEAVETPWNTTPVLAALMLTLLVALERTPRWWHGAILGLAVALAYASRYVDALWIALAAVTVLVARRSLSPRSPAALAMVVAAYVALLPSFYLHWHAFGDPLTATYRELGESRVTSGAFDAADIVPHALQVFVSPFYFDENGFRSLTVQPLLQTMFFILLAPYGFAEFIRRTRGARRTLALGFGAISIAATLFYLAYYNTGTYGLHSSGSMHYFKLWWPLWTIAAVVAVERAARRLMTEERSSA